jgi:hypothetical protein
MSNLLNLIQGNRESILQDWSGEVRELGRKRGLIDDRDLDAQTSEI